MVNVLHCWYPFSLRPFDHPVKFFNTVEAAFEQLTTVDNVAALNLINFAVQNKTDDFSYIRNFPFGKMLKHIDCCQMKHMVAKKTRIELLFWCKSTWFKYFWIFEQKDFILIITPYALSLQIGNTRKKIVLEPRLRIFIFHLSLKYVVFWYFF